MLLLPLKPPRRRPPPLSELVDYQDAADYAAAFVRIRDGLETEYRVRLIRAGEYEQTKTAEYVTREFLNEAGQVTRYERYRPEEPESCIYCQDNEYDGEGRLKRSVITDREGETVTTFEYDLAENLIATTVEDLRTGESSYNDYDSVVSAEGYLQTQTLRFYDEYERLEATYYAYFDEKGVRLYENADLLEYKYQRSNGMSLSEIYYTYRLAYLPHLSQ